MEGISGRAPLSQCGPAYGPQHSSWWGFVSWLWELDLGLLSHCTAPQPFGFVGLFRDVLLSCPGWPGMGTLLPVL